MRARQILRQQTFRRAAVLQPRTQLARVSAASRALSSGPHAGTSSAPARLDHAASDEQQAGAAPHNTSVIDLLARYRELVAQGRLKWDDEQVRVVMKLRHLLNELKDYEPPLDLLAKLAPTAPYRARVVREEEEAGVLGKLWKGKGRDNSTPADHRERALVRMLSGEEELANLSTPKGIMLTGPPGTGKSLLLSIFFDALPTAHKKRWHYHSFTLWLYQRVFKEMQSRSQGVEQEDIKRENMERAAKRGWKSVFAGGRWEEEGDKGVDGDTIPFAIARAMILEYHVLYFDELQLLDASSAALLRDTLSWFWRLGGVIVTCSNRIPEDLYYHGVQRERMAGFLEALRARCEVVELDGGRDWRHGVDGQDTPSQKWFGPEAPGFDEAWKSLKADDSGPSQITIYSRRIRVPQATGTACRFTFAELCEEPLGPADYISLSSTFSTFFIDAVPPLLLKNKNEARRLINLVDALYESRCQVYIRASVPIDELFFPDAATGAGDETDALAAEAMSETLHLPAMPNVSVYNPFEREAREKREAKEGKRAGAFSVLGIWTGEDERFAYKRAVSRLVEMTTSPTYAREAWIPLDAKLRSWEKASNSSPSPPSPASPALDSATTTTANGSAAPGIPTDYYAEEAGYSRPSRLAGQEIPREPPVIKEQHVWGMTDDWGPKAGRWGRGAKAFTAPDEDDQKRS